MSFQTKLDLSQQSRIPTGQTADWKGSVNIGETLRIGGFEIDPRSPFLGSTLLFDGFTQSYKSGKVIGNAGIATGYDGENLIISFTGSTTVGPRLQSINNLTTDGIMVNYGTDVTTVSLSGTSDFVISNPNGISGSTVLFGLSNTGVSGGTYGSSTIIPSITVDNKGRVLGISGNSINIVTYLSGLTDVSLIQPVADKSILMYDNNVDLWVNGSVAQALGYTPVTQARTLTINGESYDLTTDRSWTIDALPSQSGNTGYFLTTNGVTASWAAIPSYSGTLNRITVSGSTIDIASTYTGQTSITTLGTIGTGTWQGTAIVDTYIASAATWNGKFNTPTGLTNNYVSKWNGSAFVDSLILSRAGGLTLQNSTVIDLNTEGKSYFEFYPLVRNTVGVPRYVWDIFPETSTQFNANVGSIINITSGGDVVSGKNTVMNGITVTHRSSDSTNGNRPFVNINAIMYRPTISAVSSNGIGVHHITSQNGDNYSSIIQDGASGLNPINYSAYSLRANAIGFSNYKSISASSGVQNGNVNIILTTNTSYSSGFGFSVANRIANSNASPQIVNLQEEYIVANAGAGTSNAGKRYRHVNDNQGAASAYIMGLYRTGVIIGDTTSLPNALCSLDLVSTTTGLGLNLIAGNLGTTRNGNIWYDTVGNLFKGVQNGGVVNLLSGSLTTNTIPRANAGSLQDSYIQEITTNVGGTNGATRPYPSVSSSPAGGTGQSGFLKWVDNGSNLGELFIYKPYTNGQGAGWYQVLTNQNTNFPVLSTSSPAIGMGLSTMANSTSTAPTNLYTGEIRNLRVGSQLYGLGVFQGGAGFHYLKPFGGNQWEFSVAVNSYMRDWDWEIIGATANSGKGGGNNTLSNLSKIGSSTVKFRAMANTNSPYYYIEGVFKVNSSGAITSLVITQPSSNTTAFNVSITDTRIQFTGNAFSLAYVICEKIGGLYYGDLYTTPYQNERYSADATVKYWAGSGGLALGTTTINSRAQLELQATDKGFLPNRLTTTERDAVSWVSGDAGMIIYNTTTSKHQGWNGSTWNDLY